MTKKRKVTIVTLTIMIILVFAVLGFSSLVTAIRNERTCEWANIDNIELHAHLDIPKVTKSDCNYEKENNIKKASFTIDKKNVDLNKYIQNHHLQKYSSEREPEYGRFLFLENDSLTNADLYYKKSSSTDVDTYEVLLDKRTGRLWVTIKYKE